MRLIFRGTDIGTLTLGLHDQPLVTLPARPEEYLQKLQQFLTQHTVKIAEITDVVVVSGEGSATAVRASVTLMNTLAWANGWKMQELVLPAAATEKDLEDRLSEAVAVHLARPHYAAAPHITQTTHDALKRKL